MKNPTDKMPLDRSYNILLIAASFLGLIFSILQSSPEDPLLIIRFVPLLLIGWIFPFGGYVHGVVSKYNFPKLLIEQIKGWMYLVYGVALYIWFTAILAFIPHFQENGQWLMYDKSIFSNGQIDFYVLSLIAFLILLIGAHLLYKKLSSGLFGLLNYNPTFSDKKELSESRTCVLFSFIFAMASFITFYLALLCREVHLSREFLFLFCFGFMFLIFSILFWLFDEKIGRKRQKNPKPTPTPCGLILNH